MPGETLYFDDWNVGSDMTAPASTGTAEVSPVSGFDWNRFLNDGVPRIMDTYFRRPMAPENTMPGIYTTRRPTANDPNAVAYGISPTVWLIAAGAVVFLLVKD